VINIKYNLYVLIMLLIFSSCALIGPDRSVSYVSPQNEIDRVDLTPRHYMALQHCQKALQVLPKNLIASIDLLSPQQKQALKWPTRVNGYKISDCNSFHTRGQILDDLEDIYASKSQRIGILLPPVSNNEAPLQLIVDQIKKELIRDGYSPEQAIVIRRVEKNSGSARKVLQELIHLDRVSMILGGIHASHVAAITQMSDLTQTPALIINADAPLGRTEQTMRVYPPLKRLADKLSSEFLRRQIHDVTVLHPVQANLELFHLMKNLKNSRVNYSEAVYDPDNSNSVLTSVKSQANRIAQMQDQPGVLILDNFRMVRHVVNILSTSIPTKKILFAGNQQWRSPALASPRDESLQGAIFVDFIGNYANIPNSIDVPQTDNPYFTTAQAASRIDYQIIGYRLGRFASEACHYGLNRHEIARKLQSIYNKWDYYFPAGELAFDSSRESSWPAFLFTVSDESISEVH
jgi:hypothetical protein